jgi:hypothetical protein
MKGFLTPGHSVKNLDNTYSCQLLILVDLFLKVDGGGLYEHRSNPCSFEATLIVFRGARRLIQVHSNTQEVKIIHKHLKLYLEFRV